MSSGNKCTPQAFNDVDGKSIRLAGVTSCSRYHRVPKPVKAKPKPPKPNHEVDMCDYSLEAYQSRPAAVGEKLTLGRFASGSMGFASGTVCDTAVCIPPESRLLLQGIGEGTQKVHGVGAVEEAVLTRLKRGLYKDAVRFSNGAEVLLQRLNCGLTVVVMTYGAELGAPSHSEPAAVREPELV